MLLTTMFDIKYLVFVILNSYIKHKSYDIKNDLIYNKMCFLRNLFIEYLF